MGSAKTGVFQDFQINVKIKISALWVVVMFCFVYGDYIQLHVPGVLAIQVTELKATTDTQLELFAMLLMLLLVIIKF